MRRTILPAVLAASVVLSSPIEAVGYADWVVPIVEERAEAHGVSPWLAVEIVRCETGGTFNPYSVGAQGEQGIAQLHPQGKLPEFFRSGYDSPWDVYEASDFLSWQLSIGQGPAWSCYWRVRG